MTLLSDESLVEDPLVLLPELGVLARNELEALDSLLLELLSLSLLVEISPVLQCASTGS